MIRRTLVASLALVALPAIAHAQQAEPQLVHLDAPRQQQPTVQTQGAQPTAPADKVADAAAAKDDTKGLSFDLGFGVLIPGGQVATGVDVGDFYGPQASTTLMLNGYFTQHFGIGGGVRLAYDSKGGSACSEQCKGYSFQIPLMLEFAAKNRKEGFYGNIGMGLLTRYAVAGGGVSLTARNDGPELKLGIGYRFLMSDTRKTSVSIFAGIDRGEFSDYDLSSGSGSSSGSIARRESHTVGEIGATVSFF